MSRHLYLDGTSGKPVPVWRCESCGLSAYAPNDKKPEGWVTYSSFARSLDLCPECEDRLKTTMPKVSK